MNVPNEIQKCFTDLKKVFGSHSAAARGIGISIGYYRSLRNGHCKINEKMRFFLLSWVKKIST